MQTEGESHFQTFKQAVVPLLLSALDESFHPVVPSTVSAPILDSKAGQAAELGAELSQQLDSSQFLLFLPSLLLS